MAKKAYRNDLLPSKKSIDEGIYIDFEGFAPHKKSGKKRPPSLIGIYRPAGDCFRQIVFNTKLKRAAEDTDVGYPVIHNSEMGSVLGELVSEARKTRPLFAFSEHEFRVIDKAIGNKRSIKKRYRNVNLIAQKYFADNYSDEPVPCSLVEVAERLKLDTTDKVKDHSITTCMRTVKDACETRKKWEDRDKETRDSWNILLKHNKWDCMIMYKALLKIANKTE